MSWPGASRQRHCPRRAARMVHPCLRAEAQHVLHRRDAQPRRRAVRELDEPPRHVVLGDVADRVGGERAARLGQRLPPAAQWCRCRACPCRRPGARTGAPGQCGVSGSGGSNANCSTAMPGRPSSSRRRPDRRCDHAEVLGDQRQVAELARSWRRTRHGPARGASVPPRAVRAPSGTAQDATNPRKWSIRATSKSSNVRRRRSTHQRVPARGAAPASRRAGCPRAGPLAVNVSGGTPACRPRRKSSGCARWSTPSRRDVDRHVADEPHAAVGGVARAAPTTRARSAPGRRARARPAAAAQSSIQHACSRAERVELVARSRAPPGRRAGRGQAANAEGDLYGERASGPAGRAAASATTSARRVRASRRSVRLGAEAAAGERREVQLARRWTRGSMRATRCLLCASSG